MDFPPATHRALRREDRIQTALPGHSARNWLAYYTQELARFRERDFDLTVSDEPLEFLVRRGIHKGDWGAPAEKDSAEVHRRRGLRSDKIECAIIWRSRCFAPQ
jgi:hypothetical protein